MWPGDHFRRHEFACKCGCGLDAVDAELLAVLDRMRRHFNAPVIVTSGCRCVDHNRAVGGAGGSYHLRGQAADVIAMGRAPEQVAEWLMAMHPDRYGIGNYRRWTHIDVRQSKARR